MLQLTIHKNNVNQELYSKILNGEVQSLNQEILGSFFSVYPKEEEIQKLNAKIFELGLNTPNQALAAFKSGKL